jgi:NAD(P)-dependent dehydrogenase (short-subunit alcohol dehydrogenase family)
MDPAVVTGGASGLGEETAIRLARAGAKVAVFDLNRERPERLLRPSAESGLSATSPIPIPQQRRSSRLAKSMDPPALLLIAQASAQQSASWGRDGPMPLNDFRRVISVNLIGTLM